MIQILQNLMTGDTELAEVPAPRLKTGHVLIQSTMSLISAGTERMLLEFGKAGWLDKARQQPDKVRQVITKIKTDGLMPTLEAVRAKLDQPLPLGYCNVGVVRQVGGTAASLGLNPGDRVASNGPHAEWVCVPKHLCARIPDNVTDAQAAFTVIGAIALQSVRLAQPTLGEHFVVIGLGLIGLLTVQILQAHGCQVLGLDLDSSKCALARDFGALTADLSRDEDPLVTAAAFSRGRGVDGVIITAATKSNEPVHQAAQMSRQRGRIVLSGVTGLELRRDDFFKKELSFQVSCSYGPGRYDADYEDKGHDYPFGLVRWTEQRNLEAVLDLLATGRLNVTPLLSHTFPIGDAVQAYELIATNKEPYIGIALSYPAFSDITPGESQAALAATGPAPRQALRLLPGQDHPGAATQPTIGFIGAGNFSAQVILPALKKTSAVLHTIASSGGVSGTHLGKKFGFRTTTTDTSSVFDHQEINTVFVTTRHNSHGPLVLKALQAGKNVFVEKPLCLTPAELTEIESTYAQLYNQPAADGPAPLLMVGFNRRFAPQVQKMHALLQGASEPLAMVMTVNAGAIPPDHWTQDLDVGGGRIIGEACHFVDLLRFLAGHPITAVQTTYLHKDGPRDNVSFTLTFANGSVGTVHYFANGNKAFPKERLEVFSGGRVLQLDNFRQLWGFGWPNFKKMHLWRQDKGHANEIAAFIQAAQTGGPSPIDFAELVEVTQATFQIAQEHQES